MDDQLGILNMIKMLYPKMVDRLGNENLCWCRCTMFHFSIFLLASYKSGQEHSLDERTSLYLDCKYKSLGKLCMHLYLYHKMEFIYCIWSNLKVIDSRQGQMEGKNYD